MALSSRWSAKVNTSIKLSSVTTSHSKSADQHILCWLFMLMIIQFFSFSHINSSLKVTVRYVLALLEELDFTYWKCVSSVLRGTLILKWADSFSESNLKIICFVSQKCDFLPPLQMQIRSKGLSWRGEIQFVPVDHPAGLALHRPVSGEAAGGNHRSRHQGLQHSPADPQLHQGRYRRQGNRPDIQPLRAGSGYAH